MSKIRYISAIFNVIKNRIMPAKKDRPQIRDDKRYEALKEQGMSKQKAARIANSPASETGRKGGKSENLDDMSKQELYDRAKKYNIEGRSKMNKDQLIRAIRKGQ